MGLVTKHDARGSLDAMSQPAGGINREALRSSTLLRTKNRAGTLTCSAHGLSWGLARQRHAGQAATRGRRSLPPSPRPSEQAHGGCQGSADAPQPSLLQPCFLPDSEPTSCLFLDPFLAWPFLPATSPSGWHWRPSAAASFTHLLPRLHQ